ncbi:hypothetical protein KIN20_036620 [Parelaphostrongylus tenuis]|uniref:Uncharacterized protein n=1 Tax=Parelaphostrongylus tenuis TaxID=148309 RepID=A0AAD5WKQ5_PARTN|nr:hypothetical protein KIN20_036620 [Parelaphostrongylus tenuis]
MDATRPTRVGFDPRVERICSHTVADFDAFRSPPGFLSSTPLCRCRTDATRPTRVGFDPRVERICSHTVAAFDAFRFSPGFYRLLHCAVVGWTPHVRRESGSIPVLSAFAHIPLPLSTPSFYAWILSSTPLCRCRMDATRPTRVGFDPRVERIRSHTVAAFDAFRFSSRILIVYSAVPLSDGRHTSDESRVRSPC